MTDDEKQCPRCAETVKAEAYVCRFCGLNFVAGFKPPPVASAKSIRNFSPLYILGIIGGLFLILRMTSCGNAPEEPSSLPSQSAVSVNGAIEEAVARTATIKELAEAYKANEMRAQQDYGSQPVIITGTVRGVDLDLTDDPVVTLVDAVYSLNAYFDKDNGGAATGQLIKGQAATVQCNSVSEVLGDPVIRDCQIIEMPRPS